MSLISHGFVTQCKRALLTELASHVDHKCQWVSHVHGSLHPGACGSVALPDLHVALRGSQGEVNRIRSVHPANDKNIEIILQTPQKMFLK